MTADDELERVVIFIRTKGGDAAETLRHLHQKQTLTRFETQEWEQLIAVYAGLADALARHEHRASEQAVSCIEKARP